MTSSEAAILFLTSGGRRLARDLSEHLREPCLFGSDSIQSPGTSVETFSSLRSFVKETFFQFDTFYCIMSAGIVTRVFGPLAEDKRKDPAVIVLDEQGEFVVPLLSGHGGGANEKARRMADYLDATPVITTATDTRGRPSIEKLAEERNMVPSNERATVEINRRIVEQQSIPVHGKIPDKWRDRDIAFVPGDQPDASGSIPSSPGIWLTARDLSDRVLPDDLLVLHPPAVVAGMGSRSGVEGSEVTSFLARVLEREGYARESLASLCTIDLKREEEGLREAAEAFSVPFRTFSKQELEEFEQKTPSSSSFVREVTGVNCICETAALAGAGSGTEFIQEKISCNGITLALAKKTECYTS